MDGDHTVEPIVSVWDTSAAGELQLHPTTFYEAAVESIRHLEHPLRYLDARDDTIRDEPGDVPERPPVAEANLENVIGRARREQLNSPLVSRAVSTAITRARR
jgi:hypothetical protein